MFSGSLCRFEQEVAHGAKLFYLSGLKHGKYLKREVLNLARFISVAKTRPLTWRLSHPYLIADRFEVRFACFFLVALALLGQTVHRGVCDCSTCLSVTGRVEVMSQILVRVIEWRQGCLLRILKILIHCCIWL